MEKIYVNDLVENKDSRLYVVSEINGDNLAVLSVPFGGFYAWVNKKDVKKIGNYPYLIQKLEYIDDRLDKFKSYESFVLRETVNKINDENLAREDFIVVKTCENRIKNSELEEEIIDEYDYDFYEGGI